MINETLGIVIVNYNSAELLEQCVSAIFNSNIQNLLLKVVIVDNNSNDGSFELDMPYNQQLILIKNTDNKGFGYACNQGVEVLKSMKYLLFLNPDTQVGLNTFTESITFLKSSSDVSILGTMHKNEIGEIQTSCSYTPKPIPMIWDILGLSKVLPNVFRPATLMINFNHKESRFVDQVMGAYMLMEKDVFDKLNGFDNRFFVYYEDADFALRAKKIGFLSYYNSTIEIMHSGRGTTKKIFHITLFYNLRSRIQFAYKHYGKFCGALILFLTLTLEPITRGLYNLIKNPSENKNTFKAFKLLYRDTFK
ncbi:MAG: glycosyltransferase family 2 protein [Flaviramulus sp.]|nr:glycosyltransferase family 2 protein [Flaviramulus sp.]